MDVSAHFCYDCAFKHVSSARVLYNEISLGYNNPDHVSYLVGNLALAEVHIYELHPEIAEMIRDERKQFWDSYLEGDMIRPDFERIIDGIYDHVTNIDPEDLKELSINLDLSEMKEASSGKEEE